MRVIGLMGNMMATALRHGRGAAGIEGSTGRALGMVLECIGFILVMCMLGNGLVVRAMGVGCILARTGADM